ncbi:MAG: PAS domain-containing protein, partial [Burkholderiales bacterium]|nr:PAS domain-containing protein [Burkholderiales bacterium]
MAQINKLIIQDMQDGVLVVDEGGIIRQINTRAEQVLGPVARDKETRLADYSRKLAEHLQDWHQNPATRGEPMQTPDGSRSI